MKMSKRIPLICVDIQNDFSSEGGVFYRHRPSVQFMKEILFPYLSEKRIKVSEIISDYRQPRPGDERDCCRPGEWGFDSILPGHLRNGKPWIKSMNSPVWTRKGIGNREIEPGEPYPDPDNFRFWLDDHIGPRGDHAVVVFGLTADCCVLATVQELRWRGYEVKVLEEATDLRSGDQNDRTEFLTKPPFTYWGSSIKFEELKDLI